MGNILSMWGRNLVTSSPCWLGRLELQSLTLWLGSLCRSINIIGIGIDQHYGWGWLWVKDRVLKVLRVALPVLWQGKKQRHDKRAAHTRPLGSRPTEKVLCKWHYTAPSPLMGHALYSSNIIYCYANPWLLTRIADDSDQAHSGRR